MSKRNLAEYVMPVPQSYQGEQTLTPNGASVAATVPDGATSAWITAEGGAIYYAINDAAASANSGGYCPDGSARLVGPIDNLTSLRVFGAGGAKAHIQFFTD